MKLSQVRLHNGGETAGAESMVHILGCFHCLGIDDLLWVSPEH